MRFFSPARRTEREMRTFSNFPILFIKCSYLRYILYTHTHSARVRARREKRDDDEEEDSEKETVLTDG